MIILKQNEFSIEPCCLMLGKFDGLHLGHQLLISRMKADHYPYPKILLSFDFSLSNGPFHEEKILFTEEERLSIAAHFGFDGVILLPFTNELRNMSAYDFLEHYLLHSCNAKAVYVGTDYHFGFERKGDVTLLADFCQAHGIHCHILPEHMSGNEKTSSSTLRTLVSEGRLTETASMLGFPFFVRGIVEHGKEIGRTLGFPTLNLSPKPQKLLPPVGVYLTYTKLQSNGYYGITNIGDNPTVKDGLTHPKTVETFLDDFSENAYGQEITTYFLSSIREQKTFSSLDALKEQLAIDYSLLKENKHCTFPIDVL